MANPRTGKGGKHQAGARCLGSLTNEALGIEHADCKTEWPIEQDSFARQNGSERAFFLAFGGRGVIITRTVQELFGPRDVLGQAGARSMRKVTFGGANS